MPQAADGKRDPHEPTIQPADNASINPHNGRKPQQHSSNNVSREMLTVVSCILFPRQSAEQIAVERSEEL